MAGWLAGWAALATARENGELPQDLGKTQRWMVLSVITAIVLLCVVGQAGLVLAHVSSPKTSNPLWPCRIGSHSK